ncbi:hypothetical protein D7Y13_32875 [Corallococcus praedator]|uniref:Tenascin-X n=1 Tax=Corallococcus praedator TaxID=2316724 RepID=A0ABX9QB16_9BACT|nr:MULTISPECIES: hypothetical protein [Corallococcus]RKH31984.1 hypothetical protein D7X75_17540 [Corallococcus sp. CA031C]RKH94796.1 hypothetical protein D7Y13_32875 [Corallococcus praedator]
MIIVGATPGRAFVRLLLASGLLSLVALAACRDPAAAAGTALFVTTEFEPSLNLTQLRVSGTVAGGMDVPASMIPEAADRTLQSGETFRVLLTDAANGAQATVRVEGLRNGTVLATGEASATVRDGYEVEVTVRLASGTNPDGGTSDGGSGTFCLDCKNGCCRDGVCTSATFRTCGAGGVACSDCSTLKADTCTAQGTCGCGNGPACGANAGSCFAGRCICGFGGACGPGLACMDGVCRCDPSTCAGCCDGNSCLDGRDKNQCGKNGTDCKKCDKRCNADGSCD